MNKTKANLLIASGILAALLPTKRGGANLSDAEIWKIIQKNHRLFGWFVKRSKFPIGLRNDVINEMKITVFNRIKAGDLDKVNTLSPIIRYAMKAATAKVHRETTARLGVKPTPNIPVTEIAKILTSYPYTQAFKIIKKQVLPTYSDVEISTILSNLFFKKGSELGLSIRPPTQFKGFTVDELAENIPTPQDIYLEKEEQNLVREALKQLFTLHATGLRFTQTQTFSPNTARAIYAFARRYHLEPFALEYAPPGFHQWLAEHQLPFPPSKKGVNLQLPTHYGTIAQELGLSRERMRQIILPLQKQLRILLREHYPEHHEEFKWDVPHKAAPYGYLP